MTTRKKLINEAIDALFVSADVVGLSMASTKLLGEKQADSSTLKDIAKLALAVTGSRSTHIQRSESQKIHLKA